MLGWRKPKGPSSPAALTLGNPAEPTALLSALDELVPEYLQQTDKGLLIYPAATRRSNDADGNIRAI